MPKGKPRIDKELVNYNGGRPATFNDDDVPYLLGTIMKEKNQGLKSRIAHDLGITTPTLNKYLDKYPILQEAYEDVTSTKVDMVERSILDAIINREGKWEVLAIFYLKTKGKWRDTHHVVTENHTFDWTSKLNDALNTEDKEEIIEGNFTNEQSNW